MPKIQKIEINGHIFPYIVEYGCSLFDNCSVYLKKRLEDTQRRAALACIQAYSHTQHDILQAKVGWEKLETRR
jgi:hypothetical protein